MKFHMIAGGPKPVAPFSHAVETDGFVLITGQMPDTPEAPGTLPEGIAQAMAAVVQELGPTGVRIGIHCHDDAGCAVANTLAGVAAGATHVQGTQNGYGERCGNGRRKSWMISAFS